MAQVHLLLLFILQFIQIITDLRGEYLGVAVCCYLLTYCYGTVFCTQVSSAFTLKWLRWKLVTLFQKLKTLQKSSSATQSLVEGGTDSDVPLIRLVPEGASSNSVSQSPSPSVN